LRALALALVAALAACGHVVEEQSEWEREHESRLRPGEGSVALPPYPRDPQLIPFSVSAANEFRFFIDSASLSVEKDIVRYVLVARSPAGVGNVSYEGMRCTSGEVRIYAIGSEGAWTGKPGPWRAIEPRSLQRWHNALYREYFCPLRVPPASAREALDALRSGGAR
jgi:CNP1-like family